ncbi:signal recognition particle-docking protein FtsY [Brachybacterium sp. J153]|uniref:signal recognition particle-docking protein FtsY n=1 Tax=Brachybacterium sp. J153 TaxID=3116488 RepID=UPI002E799F53|nr:signal recognition particle-docking protein FtsY [Brachybacterium sp. J153]MEE1618887.1 signal recognition particle-docking protein FtsY [Brachybacterium sp. J153]
MDPNDIIALLAGGGAGVLAIGAGAWALVRSRGRRRPTDTDATGDDPASGSGSAAGAATAVKERPAAPTWADTLSAPSRPGAEESAPSAQQDHAAGSEAPGAQDSTQGSTQSSTQGSPATAEPGADVPFDQEVETPVSVPEPAAEQESAAEPEPAAASAPATSAPAADEQPAAAEPPAVDAPETEPESEPESEAAAATSPEPAVGPVLETPEPPQDRMVRLRERLSRSGSLGRGILTLLTRSTVDESTWDEIEETLLMADLGPDATDELLANLRRRIQVLGTEDPAAVREVLREELIALVDPALDRRLAASRREAPDGTTVPSVILMVGVNGTGKTTTVGKLARVLVAAERRVVLGAADTFRAAAADQLATWGSRVGVETIRSDRDGADPAAVAFDAVKAGIEQDADVVIVDTAGRLQNKKGLMDELGKVRRVAEKGLHGDEVAEVLLVIDATTGQNGMQQARVFSEAVNISGIVLTKLDGTAKGGIVVNVQRELGVPVKMVGLGEGMDDLTPFDAHGFVDALLEA